MGRLAISQDSQERGSTGWKGLQMRNKIACLFCSVLILPNKARESLLHLAGLRILSPCDGLTVLTVRLCQTSSQLCRLDIMGSTNPQSYLYVYFFGENHWHYRASYLFISSTQLVTLMQASLTRFTHSDTLNRSLGKPRGSFEDKCPGIYRHQPTASISCRTPHSTGV